MNREDIIRIYEKANGWSPEGWDKTVDELERFAALVYAEAHKDGLDDFEAVVLPAAIKAEREACAEVCELMYDYGWLDAKRCAREIRARGK